MKVLRVLEIIRMSKIIQTLTNENMYAPKEMTIEIIILYRNDIFEKLIK